MQWSQSCKEEQSGQREQQGGDLEARGRRKAGDQSSQCDWSLVSRRNGVRWGQRDEQGPSHVGALKAVIKCSHFISNVGIK